MMKNVSKSRYTLFSDIRFLFADARQNADRVILYMVWTAVVGVALSLVELIAIPMIVKQIEDAAPLTTVLIVVLVLAAGLFVLRWLSRYLEGAFSESQDRFRTRGSTKLVRKALTVSYPRATEPRQLNVLNRAANAMGTHVHAPIPHMWKTFSNLLINTVGAVLCASLLLVWNPWPVLLTMITAAAGAIVHRYVNRWESRHHDEEATLDARLSYVPRIVESTELSGDIRVFGLAPWLKDVHDRSMRAMQAFFYRRAKIYLVATALDALLALLRNGIAYAVLMHLIITDALPISVFLLLFAAIGVFSQYVSGWFADLSTLCRERPELHIYRRYLEQEETFRFDGGKLPEHGRLHTIELRDVTFTYPGADKPTLSHIHLTLHEGEKLAVVGRDGVGKSALVHLLCGLYDPDEGAILLDGIDVRQLDRRAYYELFSVVFQESALPDMTVEENITQQSEAVDETRLWDCLEKAGIAAMVRDLPQGLDTHIGRTAFEDGVCLSGGQTQRLLLARALYKNGDILLLDEPTAALDPLAEHTLYQEYDRMTHGKSAVFISHRLASTRFCDRIIYLNNGTIAEEGTHEELLALDGEYARLFALQSRYYREGRDPDEDEIG